MWKQRKGFAVVAKEAGVPIYPVFTENIKEAFINMESGMYKYYLHSFRFRNSNLKLTKSIINYIIIGIELWTYLYNKTKAPLSPMYGGFPVKLTTHIGDAIYPDFLTVDQIREQTLRNMTELIKKNQILPGNILRAIGERFSSENEENILDLIIDSDSKHGT